MDVNKLEIIAHEKKADSENNLFHKVTVKTPIQPDFKEVAILVGYHPHGYGSTELKTTMLAELLWMVEFRSWSYCD